MRQFVRVCGNHYSIWRYRAGKSVSAKRVVPARVFYDGWIGDMIRLGHIAKTTTPVSWRSKESNAGLRSRGSYGKEDRGARPVILCDNSRQCEGDVWLIDAEACATVLGSTISSVEKILMSTEKLTPIGANAAKRELSKALELGSEIMRKKAKSPCYYDGEDPASNVTIVLTGDRVPLASNWVPFSPIPPDLSPMLGSQPLEDNVASKTPSINVVDIQQQPRNFKLKEQHQQQQRQQQTETDYNTSFKFEHMDESTLLLVKLIATGSTCCNGEEPFWSDYARWSI